MAGTRFEAPKGTHDVLPTEWPAWQRVLSTAEELCRLYGYRRIVTPTFEETDLFARSSGEASEVVSKEMYSFEDQGGRSLTLRPEGTAQVCRAYVEHGLHREPQPVKTWMVAPMFRYAQPQKGRFREFWQLSVEAIGSDDPALDAELIALQADLLARLGIESTLLLNSVGDRACRPGYVAALEAWLDEHDSELDAEAKHKRATSPLRVFDTKNTQLAALLESAPTIADSLCADCAQHFASVRAALDAMGIEYELAPRLVRGLDYYTRTAFEFVARGLGAQDTVSAGGRYDYLVEQIGGPATPGVGFAAGIERIVLTQDATAAEGTAGIDVFFAVEEGAPRERIIAMIAALRRRGVSCDTDYAGRSIKGQLTQATRLGAATTVLARADGATIRRHGHDDENVPYDALEAAL